MVLPVRRLVQHAIAGVGFSAFVATTAIATLSSPQMLAWPTPIPWWLSRSHRAARRPRPQARWPAPRHERTRRPTGRHSRRACRRGCQAGQPPGQGLGEARKVGGRRSAPQSRSRQGSGRRRSSEAAAAKAKAERKLLVSVHWPTVAICLGRPIRDIARQILRNKYGYGDEQYSCFNNIIIREHVEHIRHQSELRCVRDSAGPARSKMASVGSDWRTNPATQIIWGIGYMKDRYGSPCQALDFQARTRLVLALGRSIPVCCRSWLVPSPSSAEGGSSPARRGRRRAALRSASRRSRTRTRGRPDGSSCPP